MSSKTRLTGLVHKAWGHELIFASNDLYCGKILHFAKANNKFSMHFHSTKDESWHVLSGSFLLKTIDTIDSKTNEVILQRGASIRIHPLLPHQLIALEDHSEIIEVSTPDSVEDNYRIAPGDNQK